MTQPPGHDEASAIWRAWLGHRSRTMHSVQPQILGWIEQAVLNGIERRAGRDPTGPIAAAHREMLALLQLADLHQRDAERARVEQLYREACQATFPAACAYVAQTQALTGTTHNASLDAVELDVLRDIDLMAHEDPTYATFVQQMTAKLAQIRSAPDVVAYSQFFEIYAEAMTLRFLRSRGIPTKRVTASVSAPDFECELADGRPYFVEVKALEIVDGSIRHGQIMTDGIEANLEIERQLGAGRQIASATSEVAPFRKAYGDTDYDPRSLKRVIDTLRDKSRGAFKASQFKRGPTFALVVADRLILKGWKSALAPFYYDDYDGGCCVSGVIWQAAFGRKGTPVLRHSDFAGKPTVEGQLDKDGLFVDAGLPFPGAGLVVLDRTSTRRVSYGLAAPIAGTDAWSRDDSEEALHAMCEAWNDADNSRAYELSRYVVEH